MTHRLSSFRLAVLLASGLAAAALVALVACGGDAPSNGAPAAAPASAGNSPPAANAPLSPGAPSTPGAPAAPGAPAGKEPKRPAFLSVKECANCHKEIAAEWAASWHGQAMTDPLFLRLSDGLKQEECVRCHAPVPLRESENWETPIARSDRREDAVSCLTCHQSGGHVTGPFDGLTGACRPVMDADQQDVTKMCFACHNQHKTGEEWVAGPYHPNAPAPRKVEARTCIDCHMPSVDRPLVEGGPVRHGRRHTWLGGHDMAQLQKAPVLDVETKVEGGTARIATWVTNKGAGHNIPTDARHRSFDVYVKVWDADGKIVLDPLDPDPAMQVKCQTTKFRLNYRNSGLADTQIPPLARASKMPMDAEKPTWKGYVDVPGVAKGHGEAWLIYRMTPEDVLVAESLTDPTFHPYRARRVAMVEFKFGE